MKKIIISGSMKYASKIEQAMNDLESLGFEALFPNFVYTPKNGKNITMEEKEMLAWAHYEKIEEADFMYCIVEDGYIGTSVKMEIGYALALKKPIYYSQLSNDEDLNFYCKKVISLEELEKFKLEE